MRKNAVASPFNEAIYKFPFQIFLILEKMPVTFFTSDAVTSNHYILFIPKTWKHSLLSIIKYETATSLSFLVESTAVDTYNYNLFTKADAYNFELARLLRIDNYFSLYNRTRYTLIESVSKTLLKTSTTFFRNAI